MHGGSRRDRGCRTDGEEGAPLVDLAAHPPGPGATRRAGGAAVHAGQQRRHDGQLVSTTGLGSFFLEAVGYPWVLPNHFKEGVGEVEKSPLSTSRNGCLRLDVLI